MTNLLHMNAQNPRLDDIQCSSGFLSVLLYAERCCAGFSGRASEQTRELASQVSDLTQPLAS